MAKIDWDNATIFIRFLEFPEHERDVGLLVQESLYGFRGDVDDYKQALELAAYCDSQRLGPHPRDPDIDMVAAIQHDQKFIEWKMLAIRHSAVTVFNLYERLRTLRQLLNASELMKGEYDRVALKAAGKMLREAFPDLEQIRTTVAHGDHEKSVEERLKRSVPGSSTKIVMYSPRGISTFHDGKQIAGPLSDDGLRSLQKVRGLINRACHPIAELASQIARARGSR